MYTQVNRSCCAMLIIYIYNKVVLCVLNIYDNKFFNNNEEYHHFVGKLKLI